ncbi:MAG: energy transducer TonB, partial [Gammaproteobacteria bacterium]|nr:energy transducer TonB [Gammaproteobacteria bacterium]
FREVSGVNIVVDQGVSGSLTLALDDVPWDFALDIVLNLKNLEKEERFNTLVILPKNKKFKWAEKAENNLTFEADIAVAEQEALIIKQQQNLPEEIIKAKEFMRQAKKAEQADNYESAVNAYEQAFNLWPDNHKIANRIASIYLVRLRQNAKAAFFAKKALTAEPANATAALNAGIALANMKEKKQAIEFFDMSINVEMPSSAALLSYAVFSEEYQEYDSALKLLNKHDAVYGKNLDSMVSVARVYDKMGEHAVSTEKYEAILLSGFRIPPDLAKFIKSRITLKQTM